MFHWQSSTQFSSINFFIFDKKKTQNQFTKSHTVTAATIETWNRRAREAKREKKTIYRKPSKLDWILIRVSWCRLFGLLFELISNRILADQNSFVSIRTVGCVVIDRESVEFIKSILLFVDCIIVQLLFTTICYFKC